MPAVGAATRALRGWVEGPLLALDVPIRSQFDSSDYQASNCGPTTLAMVLEGFGVAAPTASLRALANRLQGTYDRENGIALDYLAEIARQSGLRALGPREGGDYRRWTIDDVRREIRHGHPVITLVRMRELPDHAGTSAETDHYVVVVGLDGDRLLINDPARPGDSGFRRPLTHAQLERAWTAASSQRQGLALAAPDGLVELSLPDPLASVAPTPLPVTPTPVPAPASAPAPAAAPVIVVITPPPAPPPPVIVINVPVAPAMPVATPPPPTSTPDRWARPGRAPPETPVADPAIVLGETLPNPGAPSPWRWPIRGGILAGAALLLRRLLR